MLRTLSFRTVMKNHNKPQSDNRPSADIQRYIDALLNTFYPVSAPEDATHFFSTEEVIDAVRQIDPSARIASDRMAEALFLAGFNICNRPGAQGIHFRWMFREKK